MYVCLSVGRQGGRDRKRREGGGREKRGGGGERETYMYIVYSGVLLHTLTHILMYMYIHILTNL
jgi:hypothetical protein